MVVASGQYPYKYDGKVPIRQIFGGWPGVNTPNLGISGLIVEQGMFVLNAELRQWGFDNENLLQNGYKVYTHPSITPSGFEPKANGDTLEGLVGDVHALITVNNIEFMREMFETLLDQYSNDNDHNSDDFMESWFTSAYPESPSGYLKFQDLMPGFFHGGRIHLRPALTDVDNANDILDVDLHWLGGSGVLFDIDFGEVIFQPFPWPANNFNFSPGGGLRIDFGPITPLIQTTTGSIPTLTGRETTDLSLGTFRLETDLDAIGSGKVQIDGYALTKDTRFRLITGHNENYFPSLGSTSDFIDIVSGLRPVNRFMSFSSRKNSQFARVFATPTTQSSGLYGLLTDNPLSISEFLAVPSGRPVSIWPVGDPRLGKQNETYPEGLEVTSDGGLKIDSADTRGYSVTNDAIWITGPNGSLSGTPDSRGIYITSPYNGRLVWYRPAELIVATSGNLPSSNPGPGHFGVHLGLEPINANDFVRVSRVFSSFLTSDPGPGEDTWDHLVHFQLYDRTTMDHTPQSVGWSINTDGGFIGNALGGMLFDGTDYWIWAKSLTRATRFTSSLNFDGVFATGHLARRRYFANGKYLYSVAGELSAGDPLLSLSPPGGFTSGIGEWEVTTEPSPDIFSDLGEITHITAKRLRAETHVGDQTTALIHDIIEVTGSSHIPNGTWMLIQFIRDMYLFKIEETASEWEVTQSIKLPFLAAGSTASLPTIPADFPYEIVQHDID